jgi:predicted AlkP superfamily pyrophosphatase or phosphodiesterase
MNLRLPAMLALLLCAACANAEAPALKADAPRLLIAISVDQYSADLFNEYRSHFTGGLRRMADGVAFANGYQAHGATETCPGHSTILTGDHPAHTGIIGNDWYDFSAARQDKNIYCAEDERVPGSTGRSYTVSTAHLKVPTLGDRLKQASPASRVVSVAGKDRSAAMMGGHTVDQRWWWRSGAFIQQGLASPSPVVARVNEAVAQAIGQGRQPLVPPAFCAAKDKAIDIGGGRTSGTFRFDRKAGDATIFGGGPELDAATLALAASLIDEMRLGRGNAPDLLAIGLSATDLVGHRYGPGGLEMCLQLASIDKDLGDFFAMLDRSGIRYAVVMTADHGGRDMPERLRLNGYPQAERIDRAITTSAIGAEVAKRLGIPGPIFISDWYIAPGVPAERRQEVIALTRQLLVGHRQVEAVYTKTEILAHAMPRGRPETWSLLDRLRASTDPQRSSDLAVIYKENVTPIAAPALGLLGMHGTVWDYDRKVPILFWWPGIKAEDRRDSAMTVDIMPTLASLIGLRVPDNEIDGRCIDLLVGAGNNCVR